MVNREITFRGKNKTGTLCYGHFYIDPVYDENNKCDYEAHLLCFDEFGNEDDNIIIRDTLSQFTGCVDMFGNDIYENDTLEYSTPDDVDYFTDTVVFRDGAFVLNDKNDLMIVFVDTCKVKNT